jgi:succinylarginine dihydrolase
LKSIRDAWRRQFGNAPLYVWQATSDQLPLDNAVSSYLFNSQLLTRPDGGMTLLCPTEVRDTASARQCADEIVASGNPVSEVRYVDLRQSMNNGGGPACLRLRVTMTHDEMQRAHQGVFLDDALYERLVAWVERNYRTELNPNDLRDPALAEEISVALDELGDVLDLPL